MTKLITLITNNIHLLECIKQISTLKTSRGLTHQTTISNSMTKIIIAVTVTMEFGYIPIQFLRTDKPLSNQMSSYHAIDFSEPFIINLEPAFVICISARCVIILFLRILVHRLISCSFSIGLLLNCFADSKGLFLFALS